MRIHFWGKMIARYAMWLCACFAVATVAQCATIQFGGTLTGSQENPATGSAGTGLAVVTWDQLGNTLEVAVTFSGLTGITTASHIHCCVAPPGNIGVATTTPTFPGFPLGVTSGSYDQVFDLGSLSTYNATFVSANGGTAAGAAAALTTGLQSGGAYLNIHTNTSPGGEIRAFLTEVPEPASAPLAAASLLGLWLLRRCRR